jgi:ferredoxin
MTGRPPKEGVALRTGAAIADPAGPPAKRRPDIDLSQCSKCQGCEALCPEVFCLGPGGYMEVADRDEYPEAAIDEAIAKCPEDCLTWLNTETKT